MKKLFKFLKKYTWFIIAAVVFTYLQVMANLRLPDYTAKIVNEGIILGNSGTIITSGLLMLGVTLVGGLCAAAAGFLTSKIATGFARDIRGEVFKKVESFSVGEFGSFSTASLITRSTNDVQQMQMFIFMSLRMMLIAPLTAIGALQKALENAPSMIWINGVSILALISITSVLLVFGLPKFKLIQNLLDKLNLVARENLTGLRVVRAFNNEKREEQRFRAVNKDLTAANLFVNRLMSILQPAMGLILNVSVIVIVWIAAGLISGGTLQIGNMIAFMQYSMQLIMSFLMISVIFIIVPRASVSGGRIAEVLESTPSIKDPEKPILPDRKAKGRIEFRGVAFSYPGADVPVLTNINFTAEPGAVTAFIGSTGSGKTTLVNLIPRFYDVTSGSILIDGVDIRKLRIKDLRSQIGYVPQKGVLFSGTVKSNITYGKGDKPVDERMLRKSAEVAMASEFIEKLPKGYDSEISQGGSNFSGGQKQRLSIARALYMKPKIYIFDDSFSALDYKTDKKLRKELFKNMPESTILIVGQRISTIKNADKIIVLDNGKIVGQGTHSELLRTNDVYKEIAYSQLSEEELQRI